MAKLLKWLAGIAGGVVVLGGLAIAAITLWIDPNSFKPEMEAAAKKQGVILSLKGDLAWQFFPDLGIVVNEVSVATEAEPATPMAIIQHAALSVEVMPLFYGSVNIDGIVLEGADIRLHVNSAGIANWSQLMKKDEKQPAPEDKAKESNQLAIAVNTLSISNSQLAYRDDQGKQSVSLKGFSLQGTDIALDGEPFALATSGQFERTDALLQQQSGQFDIKTSLSVDEALTVVSLKDAIIKLGLTSAEQQQDIAITLQLTAQIPADKQPVLINSLAITSGEISMLDNMTKQATKVSNLAMNVQNISIASEPSAPIAIGTLVISSGDVSMVDNATKNTTSVSSLAMNAENISIATEPVLAIALGTLVISNADVSMVDSATKKATTISHVAVNAKTITLDNQPFPLTLKAHAVITQPETPAMNANIDFNGKVAVDETKTHIIFSDSKLVATVGDGKLQETLDVALQMAVTTEPFSYKGNVDIAEFNASRLLAALGTELPVMQSPTALHKVALKAEVKGADNIVRLENMQMQMDETAFTGKVAITDIAKSLLDINLHGNQMNADNYLAPVTEASTAQSAAPAVDENPEIIPVETLRGLAMDVDITFDKITVKALPLTAFTAVVAAHDGLVQVKTFKANLYDKPLRVVTTIDARNAVPAIDFDVAGSDLPVGQLLRDFDIEEHVSGNSDIKAVGKTSGIRKQELIKGLNAKVEMTGKQFQVAEINIEKTVCEFIAQAEQKELVAQTWDTFTKMREMSTRMTIRNGVAMIESLEAGVEEIALASTGKVDLAEGKFDMHLTTRITDAIANGGASCEVRNKKLLNRDIPIRCKGSFDDIGIKTCLPDMSVLEDIARDEAKAKLQEETDKARAKADEEVDQAKAKANEEVEKALKKKLGEDSGKAAKDLLKGLLKK